MIAKAGKTNKQINKQANEKKQQINQKTLDSVFHTVFINPDIYFKGTRLHDPERSKNERV